MMKNIFSLIFIFTFINTSFAEEESYFCKSTAIYYLDNEGYLDKSWLPNDIILKKDGKNIKVKYKKQIFLFKHTKYEFFNPHFENNYINADRFSRVFILFENPERDLYLATLSTTTLTSARIEYYSCSKTNF